MHGFDISIPRFITHVRGTCIVVTSDLMFKVLHVLRVEFPDYPDCPRLQSMSKYELLSLFCETSSSWGNRQNTSCSGFAKGSKFLNIVMTFVLHSLSNYNSITEPRAHLLLCLLQDLTIDFPSHFILSLIEVYKLIFPSTITRIICYSSVSYHESIHFTITGAISTVSVRRSEAQLRSKGPRTEIIMAQLKHMDALVNTLTTELYQANTHVSRIA